RAALEPTVESNRSAIAKSIRPEAFSLNAAFFFFPSKDRISDCIVPAQGASRFVKPRPMRQNQRGKK
ncbi:MAG: hypothetical protein WCS99_17450, partial [Limisphaerales bacterium]